MAGPALPPQRINFTPSILSTGLEQLRYSILLQGRPGSGKTHFMGTSPSPFFLIWDTALETHHKFPNIPYCRVSSWKEVGGEGDSFTDKGYWLEAIEKRRLTEIVRSLNPKFSDYKVETLCLDTLSFFGDETLLEIADGHAGGKNVKRDKWDEYYSRVLKLLKACASTLTPYPGHPERECYNLIVGVHQEAKYDSVKVNDDWQQTLRGYFPSLAGKMANSERLFSFFGAHFGVEAESSPGKTIHQIRTRSFGKLYLMPNKLPGGDRLPETLPNTWPDLMKALGR